MSKKAEPREPVDLKQCQADIPTGQGPFTWGPYTPYRRCTNVPTKIITETKRGDDGQTGSMSVCDECWQIAFDQMPANFFVTTKIVAAEKAKESDNL